MICKHTIVGALSAFSKFKVGRDFDGFHCCKPRRQESRSDWRVDQGGGICGANDIISNHVPCYQSDLLTQLGVLCCLSDPCFDGVRVVIRLPTRGGP